MNLTAVTITALLCATLLIICWRWDGRTRNERTQ